MRYEIVDRQTGTVVSSASVTRARARRVADRLNLELGTDGYFIRAAPPLTAAEIVRLHD